MRPTLAILLLCALLAMGSHRIPEASAQSLTPTAAAPSETDIIRWSFTQGALTLLLVLVLVSYRRDFFRKVEGKQFEVDLLRNVLDRTADAMLKQAVATSENTKATELLAQNVNNLAERRSSHRP